MKVTLRPIRDDEFAAWKARSVERYANEAACGLFRSLGPGEIAVSIGKDIA
jgi:hypothetical protein